MTTRISDQTLLTETHALDSVPIGGRGDARARPPAPIHLVVDLEKEYVAAGGFGLIAPYIATLPAYVDDITGTLRIDIYREMRKDSHVSSAVSTLIMAVLTRGWEVLPAVPKEDPDWAEAEKYAIAMRRMIEGFATPFLDILQEMALGAVYGHKVGELLFRMVRLHPDDSTDSLIITDIKPKAIGATAFVCDAVRNVLGLTYSRADGSLPSVEELRRAHDPLNPVILPRRKFFVFALRTEDGDPRGISLLRPAYHPWWVKSQIWAAYLIFLATFAQPSVIGYTEENAEAPQEYDSQGLPIPSRRTPEQVMLDQLVKIHAGACGAFPFGAKVELLETHNTGEPFIQALGITNTEITKTILGQTLMTEEGIHQSLAASATHQDVFGLLVRHFKIMLSDAIRRDIITPVISYNWGEDAAKRLSPRISFGESEPHDFPQVAAGLAALTRAQFFAEDQFPDLDPLLNVKQRDRGKWASEVKRRHAVAPPAAEAATNPATGADPTSPAKDGGTEPGVIPPAVRVPPNRPGSPYNGRG